MFAARGGAGQAPSADDLLLARYRLWRRYLPCLYDSVSTRLLDWPAACAEWLPPGGHVAGAAPNDALLVLAHYSSSNEDCLNIMRFCEAKDDVGSTASARVVAKVVLTAAPTAAKGMPQCASIVASRGGGTVHITDFSKSTLPVAQALSCRTSSLDGGSSLAWSTLQRGDLLVGSSQGVLCRWSLESSLSEPSSEIRLNASAFATSFFTCVEFSLESANECTVSSETGSIGLVDLRTSGMSQSVRGTTAISCLAQDPTHPGQFVSGDAHNDVSLWDWRSPAQPVHVFKDPYAEKKHFPFPKEITRLRWCPDSGRTTMFAAASGDATVRLWDTSRVGQQTLSAGDTMDGPAELVFVHGGHTDEVVDVSWSPHHRMTLASLAEDNIIQFWRPLEKALG